MKSYTGTVTSIKTGKRGSYAIAVCDDVSGSITFSLNPRVWREKRRLHIGDMVTMTNVSKVRHGWRAASVRLVRPSDEQSATSNARAERPGNRSQS